MSSARRTRALAQLAVGALLVALLAMVSGCIPGLDSPSVPAPTKYPWFDLTTGSQWVYRETWPDATTSTLTLTVLGPATFNNDPEAVKLKSTDTSQPNSVSYTYFKTVTGGISQLGQEDANIAGETETPTYRTTYSPPLFFPSNLKAGDTFVQASTWTSQSLPSGTPSSTKYQRTYTVIGTESVTVPAGTYQTLKVSDSLGMTYWLGPNGLGWVKVSRTFGGQTMTIELTAVTLK